MRACFADLTGLADRALISFGEEAGLTILRLREAGHVTIMPISTRHWLTGAQRTIMPGRAVDAIALSSSADRVSILPGRAMRLIGLDAPSGAIEPRFAGVACRVGTAWWRPIAYSGCATGQACVLTHSVGV